MFDKLSLVMVVVSDMERSTAFYRDVLGIKLKFSSPHWTEFDLSGVTLALHPVGRDLEVNPKSGVSFGFATDRMDALLEELTGRGAKLLRRDEEDFGTLASIADPDGYAVQIYQHKR